MELSTAAYNLAAIQAAAYRMIGTAACRIDEAPNAWVCHLTVQPSQGKLLTDSETIKSRFLNLVTDEMLRGRIEVRTEKVRNVILALAFGSLAEKNET